MKTLRIWILAAVIAAVTIYSSAGIYQEIDEIQERNEAVNKIKWELYTWCEDLIPVYGSDIYIKKEKDGINKYTYSLINHDEDELTVGKYDLLEDMKNGFIKYEIVRTGYMPDGKKAQNDTGYMSTDGRELTEKEYRKMNAGNEAGEDSSKADTAKKEMQYKVMQNAENSKYYGLVNNSGEWIVPPVFDMVRISEDGSRAVVSNLRAKGVLMLESALVWRKNDV